MLSTLGLLGQGFYNGAITYLIEKIRKPKELKSESLIGKLKLYIS